MAYVMGVFSDRKLYQISTGSCRQCIKVLHSPLSDVSRGLITTLKHTHAQTTQTRGAQILLSGGPKMARAGGSRAKI